MNSEFEKCIRAADELRESLVEMSKSQPEEVANLLGWNAVLGDNGRMAIYPKTGGFPLPGYALPLVISGAHRQEIRECARSHR